ncbi:hypothetical protein NQ318_004009 [Aromia moschata]|uniref:Uncharacterized protein n=1 Tax=Aromia moschata TaxID=1265417 RepID=A0AAV8Z807_9CUCU|nr:hypothetical protein NQ318_004009 [Aromia moschata]
MVFGGKYLQSKRINGQRSSTFKRSSKRQFALYRHSSNGSNRHHHQTKFPPPPDVTRHKNLRLLPEECGLIDIGDKIRNGQNADFNEFPWMALLSYRSRKLGQDQSDGIKLAFCPTVFRGKRPVFLFYAEGSNTHSKKH